MSFLMGNYYHIGLVIFVFPSNSSLPQVIARRNAPLLGFDQKALNRTSHDD